jgi:hypothetical protein
MNEEKYLLKKSDIYTKIAKNIFGDIVRDVYLADVKYDFYSEEEVLSNIEQYSQNITTDESATELSQDALTIVIEFINDKKVVFTNSEWGSMAKFSEENIFKIV